MERSIENFINILYPSILMVYEKKCAECGDVIDFGGKDRGNLPDDAIEFNDDVYCKDCVRKFVEFGTGRIMEDVESLKKDMSRVRDQLGLEKME